MKEYILLDDDNNVVKHICADDNFTSEKYKVVEELNWEQDEQDIESETEPAIIEQESVISTNVVTNVDTNVVTDVDIVEETKQAKDKTLFTSFTRTDKLTIQLQEIDVSSVRAIRAILSGTDTEEDHKILKALEKQAIDLRKELNTVVTNVTTNVVTDVVTNK